MIEVHFKEDVLSICNNDKFYYKPMRFSAGEEFVKLHDASNVESITWKYEGDHELMTLGLIYDIVKNYKNNIKLYMPYIPHARQDRATHCDQPYSFKVFANILKEITNSVYTNLLVVDPHSEVSVKLLHSFINGNVVVKEQYEFAQFFVDQVYDYVVAPDKGAAHKTVEWAKVLGVPMFMCNKNRNPSTGHITSYNIPNVDLTGKKVLIPDDIIDGGRSVIMVSDVLRNQGCNFIDIFTTHGIFSKGIDVFSNIDHIYTTDSLLHAQKIKNLGCSKLTIFNCFE